MTAIAELVVSATSANGFPLSKVFPLSQTCAKCSTRIPDDAVFCSKCGLNLTLEHSRVFVEAPDVSETFARIRDALIDRYVVERELGRGGMATVFLAKDLKHEREVAIKVLHPDLAASLGGERFLREIRLAAKLQHPHILGMYDSGASGDLMYYMMPFVRGESLRDKIDRDGMLPVDEALRIILEVADALGHAHAQGVVHRDIKPENILLSGDHALVADFGIASAVSDVGTQKLTQTGMAVGTPVYMAPEQASGETTGPTADIYSLGCMLYEMLSGEPPFTGPNPMAIMARHLMEQVPSVRIVRSAVPEDVENAIFFALQKQPVDRPQTAAQFVEALSMSMGGTATMRAMRNTAGVRRLSMETALVERTPWWRKPLPASSLIVGVLLVLVGGGYAAKQSGWFGQPTAGISEALDKDAKRIAVLYFENISGDTTLNALADGLTEELIQSLATSQSLTIISKAGVAPYRGTDVSADSIASALGIGFAVRGKVDLDGGRVRVTVSLDDKSGSNLERKALPTVARDSLLALRSTISTAAAELIRKRLGSELQLRSMQAATTSEAAWLLAQRGSVAQLRGEELRGKDNAAGSEASFNAADSLFADAERADRAWSVPVTRRANLAYRRSRLASADAEAMRKWATEGLAFANRAVSLNPSDPDALEARGTINYWMWLRNVESDPARKQAILESAQKDLEGATGINPNQASAWATLSHLYYQIPSRQTIDVSYAAKQALRADEFLTSANLVLGRLFNASYDQNDFANAETSCATLVKRFSGDVRSKRCRLYLLTNPRAGSTDLNKAWLLADSMAAMASEGEQELERQFANMLMAAITAHQSTRVTDAALKKTLADSARSLAKRSVSTPGVDPARDVAYLGSFVFATLGDAKEAVQLLKAYVVANPERAAALRENPGWWFTPIQSDPEFRNVITAQP